MTKSILSEQREADEALCDSLEAVACGFEGPNPWLLDRAATRITELSQDFQEACHDRDRYQAEVERMGWQPIETAPEGVPILVCVTYNIGPDEWETEQWVDWISFDYVWPVFKERIDIPLPPTHWQPLPPPPGEK